MLSLTLSAVTWIGISWSFSLLLVAAMTEFCSAIFPIAFSRWSPVIQKPNIIVLFFISSLMRETCLQNNTWRSTIKTSFGEWLSWHTTVFIILVRRSLNKACVVSWTSFETILAFKFAYITSEIRNILMPFSISHGKNWHNVKGKHLRFRNRYFRRSYNYKIWLHCYLNTTKQLSNIY